MEAVAGRVAGDLREIAGREAELRGGVAAADMRAAAAERSANGRRADAAGEAEVLRAQAEELSALASEAGVAADAAASRANAAARALAEADPGRSRRPNELLLERLAAGAARLEAALAADADRFEAPVRERAEAPWPRRGPGGPVRHLRALPPAQGQRRPHGQRDGRAWDAGHGLRRSRRRDAA